VVQLFTDDRIGGKPRYILDNEAPDLMHIPDEIRKCVVFIGNRGVDGEMEFRGTAFLAGRLVEDIGSWIHLVTAAHIIRGMTTLPYFDGKVLLRVNDREGAAQTLEVSADKWLYHPEEENVDVAVLPFVTQLAHVMDTKAFPLDAFLNEEKRRKLQCGIGDEVFLPGLFYNHKGRKRNIPIVRVGNVAAMMEEKVLTKLGYIDAFLVEARSIGGLSGSPVFLSLGFLDQPNEEEEDVILVMRGGAKRPRPTFHLLGLMHGHYNADLPEQDDAVADSLNDEVVNMGIAIVIPSEKIMEVLEQPMIRDKELEAEQKKREETLPVMDSVSPTPELTKDAFETALKQASQKVSPHKSETKETSE
jgi:hypothetical protein